MSDLRLFKIFACDCFIYGAVQIYFVIFLNKKKKMIDEKIFLLKIIFK